MELLEASLLCGESRCVEMSFVPLFAHTTHIFRVRDIAAINYFPQ